MSRAVRQVTSETWQAPLSHVDFSYVTAVLLWPYCSLGTLGRYCWSLVHHHFPLSAHGSPYHVSPPWWRHRVVCRRVLIITVDHKNIVVTNSDVRSKIFLTGVQHEFHILLETILNSPDLFSDDAVNMAISGVVMSTRAKSNCKPTNRPPIRSLSPGWPSVYSMSALTTPSRITCFHQSMRSTIFRESSASRFLGCMTRQAQHFVADSSTSQWRLHKWCRWWNTTDSGISCLLCFTCAFLPGGPKYGANGVHKERYCPNGATWATASLNLCFDDVEFRDGLDSAMILEFTHLSPVTSWCTWSLPAPRGYPNKNVQIFGYVYQSTNGPNRGPAWKTQSFLSKGICTVTLWQDKNGKSNLKKFYWNTVGKRKNWECVFVNRARRLFLPVYVDDIKLAGKTENIEPTWKLLMEEVDLGEPTSFLDHVYLGCTQRECQISNDILANCRDMFDSRIFSGTKEKLPTRTSGKPDAETISSRSYDMESHAKKCVERYCELANKTTQQLFKVATPCMDDHQFKEEENESVGELSTVCPQMDFEMSVFGLHSETWYFVVCEQTCSCCHKVDKSLWQTFSTFDLPHSSNMWLQTISCGKHCQTMQTRIVSRLWFCRRPWRLKIYIKWNIVHVWKSHACANKLDVQETDISVTQFHRSWNHFSRCRFTHGRYSRSHSLGFGDWSLSFRTEQNRWTQERAMGNPVGSCQAKHA